VDPLATIFNYVLGVLLIASITFSVVQYIEVRSLRGENETLTQNEANRELLAAQAIKDNKAKEIEDAKKTKQQDADNEILRSAVKAKSMDVTDLANRLAAANRLRNTSPGSCGSSEVAKAAGIDSKADTPLVSGGTNDWFGTVVEIARNIASEADLVRADMITCQTYVKGLQ
jgi:predicted methyltransferase MtxX (methanogen marker protein 4)